ncbi:hypothetical protein, partial [Bacillus sp. 7884-1]|uniref:hypothetical protein n=1 Tax=Bacillus sp. 7884-1 TaxID=2021693 RepID=UPI000BDB1DB0
MNKITDEFVTKNIKAINQRISDFKGEQSKIKRFLQQKFLSDIKHQDTINKLIERLRQEKYVKARIENIANDFVYYKAHLADFYSAYIYSNVLSNLDINYLKSVLESTVSEKITDQKAFNYIKSDFKKISEKFLILIQLGGFQSNLMNLNEGV